MGEISLAGVQILHIHTLPVVSGSGINTFLTMRGSRDQGAIVSLASAPGGRLEQLVQDSRMNFIPIRNFVSEVSLWKDVHALWQLDRLLATRKFDIVHTHNSKAGFLGRLAAWRKEVSIVVHTVHGFAFHDEESWFFRRAFIQAERIAAGWCHRMIAISQPMLEWALQERITTPDRIEKIHSGIEVDQFQHQRVDLSLRKEFGIGREEIAIGIVSKLWEGKGHEVLVDAVARLLKSGYPIKLLIVGEGVLEGYLREKVNRLGIDGAVVFMGFRSDIPEITSLLDISVLPSFFEGMGRVVLEAMACGKPVVASRVGGLPELVEDGVTGYLVPPGDVGALAERLEALVSDVDLRRKMGEQGSRRVRKEHSAAEMVRRIHGVYGRFLAPAGSGARSTSPSLRDRDRVGVQRSGTEPGVTLRP